MEKTSVSVQLEPDLRDKLDTIRGDRSRAQYLRLLIKVVDENWLRLILSANPGSDQRRPQEGPR